MSLIKLFFLMADGFKKLSLFFVLTALFYIHEAYSAACGSISGPALVTSCTSQLTLCKATTAKGAIGTGAAAAMGGVAGGALGSGSGGKGAVKGAMLGAGIGAVAATASQISGSTCKGLGTKVEGELAAYNAAAVAFINANSTTNTAAATACATELESTRTGTAACLSKIQSEVYGNLITAVTVTAGVAATLKIAERLKDKKKDKENNSGDPDGTVHGNGYTIYANLDGGQCVKTKQYEKCYTNSELSRLCFSSQSSTMPNYGTASGTMMIQDGLCKQFLGDGREGGGADPETCFVQKPDSYKDQACQSRMLTQCLNSEMGDCAKFNQHYCHDEETSPDLGADSNYCTFRLSKDFCNQGGGASSPSCAWMRQLSGTSCPTKMDQETCYPSTFSSYEEMKSACSTMGLTDRDPLCKVIDSHKMYFGFRHPGRSSSSDLALFTQKCGGTYDRANLHCVAMCNHSSNANDEQCKKMIADLKASESVDTASRQQCVKPNMDCALVPNRDTPACIQYYCCQPINAAAAICKSLNYGVAFFNPANSNASGNPINYVINSRYPAGSLPSDINVSREEGLVSSNTQSGNVAQRLCSQGQLYDCGALQGIEPRN